MDVQKGIQIFKTSLFLEKSKTLIISDLHIGQEYSMKKLGFLIPLNHYKEILANTKKILETSKPSRIIINGDLKHDFGKINNDEWDKITQYLKELKKHSSVIVIKGNHDALLQPVMNKLGIKLVSYYFEDETSIYVCHGDRIPTNPEFKKAKTIIIGHEHPAIRLSNGARVETYKCFIKGKFERKNLIVMPSSNPINEGSDVLSEKMLSPFLKGSDIKKLEAYILGENEVFYFGKIKNLKALS